MRQPCAWPSVELKARERKRRLQVSIRAAFRAAIWDWSRVGGGRVLLWLGVVVLWLVLLVVVLVVLLVVVEVVSKARFQQVRREQWRDRVVREGVVNRRR